MSCNALNIEGMALTLFFLFCFGGGGKWIELTWCYGVIDAIVFFI